MAKSLTEMAAEIVAALASHTIKAVDEVSDALKKAFEALQSIKGQEEGEAAAEEKVDKRLAKLRINPAASIQKNKVVCLECGKEFKQLSSRHLKDHDLDLKAYRKKYGLKARQALTAKSLSAKRRRTAKELGLGEKLVKARKQKAATAKPPPKKKPKVAPAAKPARKKTTPKQTAVRKKKA